MTAQNKTQNDGLFLLEVLIDKITFEKTLCLTDKDFRTCVTVECLNVAPLEICDDEPGAGASEYKSGGPFVKNFNNGKSCLFSLQEGEISKAMGSFTIKITVSKSLPCGCLPNKIVMGEAAIDMTKEFVETRNNFLKDPNNVSYQALKDSFKIRGPDNIEVGDVIMFLRISCFGKLIITKFQGSGGPPQLTGGSNYVDRSCNPPRESQTRSDPCACGVGRSAAAGSSFGGGGAGGAGSCMRGQDGLCPVAQSYYNSAPCEEPDDPCFCSGPRQEKRQQLACRNTDPYCLHLPKDCCPTGNKIVFQMPSDSCNQGHKQRAHFNFTSDGVGDVSREEPGQLVPPTAEDYKGVTYDYTTQVIKLRVGRTIELPGRKSKMEYQFITPVENNDDPKVPVTDTRTAQCVCRCPECCIPRCVRH